MTDGGGARDGSGAALAPAAAGEATIDVSGLPAYAFGARAPLWWGVLLLVAIEATSMGLLLVSQVYLRANYEVWPPSAFGRAAWHLALAQVVLLGLSAAPMVLSVRAARRERLGPTRRWLAVATALGAAMLVVRAFEIPRLGFRWDSHAYGSVFWMSFGLHITHVLTGVLENAMLLGLLFLGPVEKKHYSDIEASALLWYFSVIEWAPAFAILYLWPVLRGG